jgi:hypothetical protein
MTNTTIKDCIHQSVIYRQIWNKDLIKVSREEKKRTVRFKLKIKLNQISDNTSLKFSSSQFKDNEGFCILAITKSKKPY